MNLNDKVSIITGGASGIGAATCRAFAAAGAKVVVVDVNADGAKKSQASSVDSPSLAIFLTNKPSTNWLNVPRTSSGRSTCSLVMQALQRVPAPRNSNRGLEQSMASERHGTCVRGKSGAPINAGTRRGLSNPHCLDGRDFNVPRQPTVRSDQALRCWTRGMVVRDLSRQRNPRIAAAAAWGEYADVE